MYGQPLIGERLVDGAYEPYEVRTESDGSVRSYSALLDLIFSWDEVRGFDLLDPVTGRTIDKAVIDRAARLVAEAGENAECEAWLVELAAREAAEARADTAETRAEAERERADAEREARLAEQAKTEARERALRNGIERLRHQQFGE